VVRIGCQISIAQGLEKALLQAIDIGAETFQFFTRNPRGSSAREIGQLEIDGFSRSRSDLAPFPLIAHLPYTVNMMSASPDTREFAAKIVASDIERMRAIGVDALVVHPGSRLSQPREEALMHLVTLLTRHVLPQLGETWFLLETMSGSGSEMGSIEDIGEVINSLGRPPLLGVCLDTCHLFAAGYDLRQQEEIVRLIKDLDRHIGLDRVRCVHINDSKFGPGLHKDRHEKVGEGLIGREGLANMLAIKEFSHLPFILETPVDDPKDYALEIAKLRGWIRAM
jgi:deoxyribonuclease IV